MNRIIFTLVFILGVMTACSDKLQPEGPDDPAGDGNPVTIENTDIVFTDGSDLNSFSFKTGNNWTIELSDNNSRNLPPQWFTVSSKNGSAGDIQIQVKAVEENPYNEDRSAYIRIRSMGKTTLVMVTQKKKGSLTASKDHAEFGTAAGEFRIDMQSGIDYQVNIPEEYNHWISRQQSSNTSPETFKVTANNSGRFRAGIIIFTGGSRADTVNVYQRGGAEQNCLLENPVYIDDKTHINFQIPVRTNVEVTFQIEGEFREWIFAPLLPLTGRAPRVDRAYLDIAANRLEDSRSGKVVFTNTETKKSDTLVIVQRGSKELVYFPEGEYTVEAEGEILMAQVRGDLDFNVDIPQRFSSWLSVGARTTGSPNLLPVTIKPNETNYVRNGYVVLETPDLTVTDTIHIRQLCKPDDRGILTAFYETTYGPQWTNKTNWCTSAPLDQWYGITTNDQGKVTRIELSGNNLSGKVIDYTIDLLENLTKLDLSQNRLTDVTARIGNLEKLRYLDLSANEIRSTFPDDYVNLVSTLKVNTFIVREMDLFRFNDNYYYGEFPFYFGVANIINNGKHYFDIIKQKGAGFEPVRDFDQSQQLPDVRYTDIDGRSFGLHEFCKDNTYNVLFRSKEINQDVLNYLKKLDVISRSGIPEYKLGVIWDAVDTGLSAAELDEIRQSNNLDITIVSSASGQLREEFKYGELSEFCLTNYDARMVLHNYDIQRIYDYLLPAGLYFSQDYSKDKTYRTVQTATVGNGVDIVFAGDGFTDKDIASGKYDLYAQVSFDAVFSIEPFKSLRDRFNLYVVYAVSRNNDFSHPSTHTVFGSIVYKPEERAYTIGIKNYSYDNFALYKSCTPVRDVGNTTLMIAVNHPSNYGIAIFAAQGSGGVGLTTLHESLERYKGTTVHEIGHSYGGLQEEYIRFEKPSQYDMNVSSSWWESYGWNANIDFTDDLSKIKWKQFIGIPKYSNVGAFEGCLFDKGAWRPETLSVMENSNYPYFNAPSREAIYKRTMILSGEGYSFEDFVAQDNVTPPPLTKAILSAPQPNLCRPIIRPPGK